MQHQPPQSFIDELKKSPWWPLLGAVVYFAPEFISEPDPPTITPEMPQWVQTQTSLVYEQNMNRFNRRMRVIDKLGTLILGGSVAGAVVHAQHDNAKHQHAVGHAAGQHALDQHRRAA